MKNYLKTVVSVVDVDRIYREFLHSLATDEETEDGDVINLIMDQIEFCNLMILNKTDLLSKEQLNEVKEELGGLQQEAEMIECVNGEVNLDVILNREDFDFDEVEAYSAVRRALNNCEHDDEKACVDEYGISSFVFEERKPFNRVAFNKLIGVYILQKKQNTSYKLYGTIGYNRDIPSKRIKEAYNAFIPLL